MLSCPLVTIAMGSFLLFALTHTIRAEQPVYAELVKLNDRSPSASTADSHGFQMRTLDNIVSVKLDEIDDRTEEENDCNAYCDHMYIHTDDGSLNGTFSSPNHPKPYPSNLQCIYTFIAKSNYRVKLVFNSFLLSGSSAKCEDYIDVYSMLEKPDIDLLSQPLSGRYCATVSPNTVISLHNVIVIVFHVREKSRGAKGFSGVYSFIPDLMYAVGTQMSPQKCHFVIYSSQKAKGIIYSPTYPGKYPFNIRCVYRLIGEPRQRIRLEFEDFDVYFGGDHCPYDSLTVYDGDSYHAPIIQKVCGLQQSLELFSEAENLYLEFVSNNQMSSEHRGFKIAYEFSQRFVSIDQLNGGQFGITHLRGTECDLRVQSSKENEHVIMSPNYPQSYPSTTCTYILDGLQGAQDLEKVLIHFETLQVTSNSKDCDDAYVAIFLNGQDWKSEIPDAKFCSANVATLPDTLESLNPRMTVVLRTSNSSNDRGFKAVVKFETVIICSTVLVDFGIPGTPASDSNECTFHFNSLSEKEGTFNSPRYPENYPVDTVCIYWLNGKIGERVRIYFDQFVLAPSFSKIDRCADRLELYNVFSNNRETLLGKYCAENYPGPILSAENANRIRAIFIADAKHTATGFRAHYQFIPQKNINALSERSNCAARIVGSISGTIVTPNFPQRYVKDMVCHWEIRVRIGYRILLQPVVLNVEGMMGDDGKSSNCRSAVIRIKNDSSEYSKEFCGEKVVPGIRQFISAKNIMHISFLTHPEKVNGLSGFNFSWTEFTMDEKCNGPDLFRCNFSKYCISSKVRCNDLIDCGEGDNSDELHCKVQEKEEDRTVLTVGITATVVVVTILIVILISVKRHQRMKRARKRLSNRIHLNVNRLAEHTQVL
ncbi:Cubilin [Trichinella nelsoni]|uniref:Cubilin n=1 Tax=Trichinella nelsoni TaxID=6336 RepID=A0A0V0RKT4_9BILA|nr:Cubilin [Trichinella nelsoni]